MNSDPKLKRLYNRLNVAYFEGHLPAIDIWWEPCGSDAGLTLDLGAGDIGVKLCPSLMGLGKYTTLVLLHEMCHVRLWMRGGRITDHGRLFDAEIVRLTQYKTYRKLL